MRRSGPPAGPAPGPSSGRVCVCAVAGAHGVRGAVRLKCFTERAEDAAGYGPVEDESGARRFEIEPVGRWKGGIVARLAGIDSREAAEALRGVRLYVSRSVLPPTGEDEFYHADLIGLETRTVAGEAIGSVLAVHDFGAGDMLEIRRLDRSTVLVPFRREMVPEVNVAGGYVVVDPPAGLMEDEEER